ncbi:hypothetical protein MD484_g7824, partial [Candolleomyces efflorescens]
MLIAQLSEGANGETSHLDERVEYSGGHVGSQSLQLVANHHHKSAWVPIRGGQLVLGLAQLMKKSHNTDDAELVEAGWEGADFAPLYIARVITEDGCYPGECGFHFAGARIPRLATTTTTATNTILSTKFEALNGPPGCYIWKPVADVFELSKIDDMNPVLGGHQCLEGDGDDDDGSELRRLYVARSSTVDGRVHLGYVAIGSNASICYEGTVMTAKLYEVLVHNNSNSNAIRALIGTYVTDGWWTRTKEAERYSETINFSTPFQKVPRIALGLTMLDIGRTAHTVIRVNTTTNNITKENFVCTARSWREGIFHNAKVDWIAIDNPTWQCGVFNSQDTKTFDRSSEHRINFSKPFEDAPPMVFVCFSGLDLTGKWNARVYATNVDPAGFTIAIINCGEEGGLASRLISAAVNWIAVPASDVMKKKNVWIGGFATGRRENVFDSEGGHVDFRFTFKRTPKVFVGLRQFSAGNERNLRLRVTKSSITTQGMDWNISKWDDTLLYSAGANFIAVDVE